MSENAPALISLSRLDRETINALLDRTESFLAADAATAYRSRLAGEAAALLFCEPSTRTRFSFDLAARRLGADVLTLNEHASSRTKGETLADTIATLAAMDARLFVVRHRDNGIMERLGRQLPAGTCLVNAGEGTRAHPTQGLLDVFTIRRHRPALADLAVAIVGDIVHSRVARSTVAALDRLGVSDLRLVGPDAFLSGTEDMPGRRETSLERGLDGADVVIALRIQRERMAAADCPDTDTYRCAYGLNADRLDRLAGRGAMLLHPGPVNWGVELAPELADWPRSLIREQVRNGVAVRMAVLDWLRERTRDAT